ncbi:MAG: alginate export family protein, partial [Bacteroidota bacterium]
MKGLPILLFIFLLSSFVLSAQEETKKEPPSLQLQRAKERYDYLQDPVENPYEKGFADVLKFIPLSRDKSIYLSLGGQYRARVESFTNRNWTSDDATFYSQRVAFHSDIHLGKYIRLFGELYHGAVSDGEQFLESDELDLHQGYLEITIPTKTGNQFLLQLGRQELSIGAGRLVGLREGPNMRRSFDLAKIKFRGQKLSVQALYGKEVDPQFGVFDNEFNLFNEGANNPIVWSIGVQLLAYNQQANLEIYYTGFESKMSRLSDVVGEEMRHSIGLRSYGKLGTNWSFNTELIYQFGDLAGSNISA